MNVYSKYYLHSLWLSVLLLGACGNPPEHTDVDPKTTLTLRAATALDENSIAFSSYSGATVDIIINDGAIQTFAKQDSADWIVEVDGVNVGQDNTIEVEWYIQQDEARYTIATQSGSFNADPGAQSKGLELPYETDSFDHDADTVSNLVEVNAGGFPVPATAIPNVIDIVSPGVFTIGSAPDEVGAYDNEMAATSAIANNYSIGKYEVTYAQFQTYVEATGAQSQPTDNGWGGGELPVTNISWSEAYAYTAWLSKITGKNHRLPTEAEWEYAARGDTTTPYYTGQTLCKLLINLNQTQSPVCFVTRVWAYGMSMSSTPRPTEKIWLLSSKKSVKIPMVF